MTCCLAAGNYTLYAYDKYDCQEGPISFEIEAPDPVELSEDVNSDGNTGSITSSNLECDYESIGTITASAIGGNENYTYNLTLLGTAPPCEDNDAALAALGGCAAAIAVLGCDFVFAGTPIGENCSVSCETYCEGDPIISSNSSGELLALVLEHILSKFLTHLAALLNIVNLPKQ